MSAARPDTWMPFYIGDYLKDTGRLTTEGHGAYLLLIMDYWTSGGPLPDDDEQLAALTRLPVARWKKLRPTMERFFQASDGVWRHKRIDAELADAVANIERQAARTKAATDAKKAKGATRNDQRNDERNVESEQTVTTDVTSTPSPSPSPSPSSLRSEERSIAVDAGASADAKRLVKAFKACRFQKWPTESAFPAPDLTLEAQAAELLAMPGATFDLLAEVLRRETARDERRAASSFKAYGRSLEDAVLNHRKAGLGARDAPPAESHSERLRRLMEVENVG